MKFSRFEFTDNGISINVHSGFLDWIFKIVGKRVCRKMVRKKIISKNDKVTLKTKYNIQFVVEKEKSNNE